MEILDIKIEKQRIVNLSVDTLYWKWSTHEGLLTFFGYNNKIELTPGGAYEIYFLENNPEGLRGSEDCKVVSFVPNQRITFTWNSPPHYEEARNSPHKTLVEVSMKPISDSQSEITIIHSGWPQDPYWDEVFDYFDIAWDVVLNKLEKGE